MSNKDIVPIFIGGCQRSGTTFLGSLLGKFNKTITVPESQFKTLEYSEIKTKKELKKVYHKIKNNFRFKIWNIDLNYDDIKDAKSFGDLIKLIVKKYANINGKNPIYWIDHSPNNFKYAIFLKEIFPKAKYIHLIRDGRAVANSILSLHWGPNTVKHASRWWIKNLSFGLAAESFFNENEILRVHYEDLVLHTEKKLNKICNFIGIDFDSYQNDDESFEVPKYTKNQHNLVGKPPEKDRINAWKRGLTNREIELFEFYTNDFLSLLGYEKQFVSHNKPNYKERLFYEIYHVYKKFIGLLKQKYRKYTKVN